MRCEDVIDVLGEPARIVHQTNGGAWACRWEAIAAILRDQEAPVKVRIAVADYLGTDQTSSMDNEDWKEEALASVLDDPCGLVRVAAAKNILRTGVILRTMEPSVAWKQLVASLEDPDVHVRRASASVMAEIRETSAPQGILRELFRGP
jgi:HEAT repeat protein